jgi:predicted nuclease of restriction endonuclease-like (RecB) superfamily
MKLKVKTKALVPKVSQSSPGDLRDYARLLTGIADLLESARRTAARTVNSILTATYWEIGRRIVEYEQGGKARSTYGEELLNRLSKDLSANYGRGFSRSNVAQMRVFYLSWQIVQTPSGQFRAQAKGKAQQTASLPANLPTYQDNITKNAFPLSWSHYVELMSVSNDSARAFYEMEAIRGGWSVRQLDRQISTQFFERALNSKTQDEFLARGRRPKREDLASVEEEVRDPYLLEFLNLKDEYSESDLEEALIRHLEWFLLEMGTGFTFVGRQKRIRVGDSWYRMDLLLYHRKLRCLVIVDLKRGKFSHADAGQMNLYLNYAKEHLMLPGEADPVGIILCGRKNEAVVKYATGGIKAKVFASEYLTFLPDEEALRQEILKTRRLLEARQKEGKFNA